MEDDDHAGDGFGFFSEEELEAVAVLVTPKDKGKRVVDEDQGCAENDNGREESSVAPIQDKGKRVAVDDEEMVNVTQESIDGGVFSSDDGGFFADPYDVSPVSQPAVVDDDGAGCAYWFTPNGTRYWKPIVEDSVKPDMNARYREWQDVVKMYESYAEKCGFSIRIGTVKRVKGVITHRYILCSKAGKPQTKRKFDLLDESSLKIRQSTFQVCDCKASIRAKICNTTSMWQIYHFEEAHNHMLVPAYNRDLTKIGRKLDFATKDFIHRLSLNKVGPSVAHRMQVSLKGGHHNVRGTPADYKNFARSMRMFIGSRDSQMLIDKLNDRVKNLPNFSFKYSLVNGELRYVFWADEISKINYQAFGDVLAFDATYQTNRYNLIFVPFTGVDNNKRCVTFGAGLLFNETIESYCWLLNTFLGAHGKQPKLVLTDQDPAMKQAVAAIFTEARHRLCMWHIMKKLPAKLAGGDVDNSEVRAAIHKLVWNVYIKPSTFESRWGKLLDKHGLTENDWLRDMFNIRELWVPAYFREIPMSCLMKTTSRCESSNAAFKVNSSWANTLVQFLLCFDTTMDSQRYKQRVAVFQTDNRVPELKTGMEVEKQCAVVYSQTIFHEVRKEIQKALLWCFITKQDDVDGMKVYTVTHLDKRTDPVNDYTVKVDCANGDVTCSCNSWTRIGYLCRHIFCVFRYTKVEQIPDKYIMDRWRRDALPKSVFSVDSRYGVDHSDSAVRRNELLDMFNECVDRLSLSPERLSMFSEQLKGMKEDLLGKVVESAEPEGSNQNVIANLLGVPEEVEVSCSNPHGIRNKGCGTNRRLIGPGEKAVTKNKKHPRQCKTCLEFVTGHDSRNCPTKKKDAEP